MLIRIRKRPHPLISTHESSRLNLPVVSILLITFFLIIFQRLLNFFAELIYIYIYIANQTTIYQKKKNKSVNNC